jgi:hypothetical protein
LLDLAKSLRASPAAHLGSRKATFKPTTSKHYIPAILDINTIQVNIG